MSISEHSNLNDVKFERHLQIKLNQQKDKNLIRKRIGFCFSDKNCIDFSSNDYLGLSQLSTLKNIEIDKFGSGGSHLISGHHQIHSKLESAVAKFLQRESALTFSTGYMANLAILQTLAKKNDLIISDKFNHVSIVDGIKLSGAESVRYPHLDLENLEKRLQRGLKYSNASKWVITDSLFSMDGDLAPLKEISILCKKYKANLIVDDAHGFGVLGKNGRGVCEAFNLDENDCPVLMSTLGKALGGYGAVVSGKKILIDYLIQFARPYIYTTACPPLIANLNLENLERLRNGDELRGKLKENISFFRNSCHVSEISLNESKSPIQIIEFDSVNNMLDANIKLKEKGFVVGSIRPPTAKSPRFRITITANHSKQDIKRLVASLRIILNNFKAKK